MDENKFPRQLTSNENMHLLSVLPENKIGYKSYRDKINTLRVIGPGRFGGGNFILGKENSKPDLSLHSTPVFALGTNIYKEGIVDITIHEEIDDEIEYDISFQNQTGFDEAIPDSLTEIKRWSYSEWEPGNKAPNDNSFIREVKILDDKYLLAFAPVHKKIWLHEYGSGINYLIPVTNFHNELMRVCNIKDVKIALSPSSFFNNLQKFTDDEFKSAFISYNRYLKRIDIKEKIPLRSEVKDQK